MSDHILKTIEQAMEELRKQEEAVIGTKRLINQLSTFAGNPQPYQDAELKTSTTNVVTVRRNTFFGKPLATAVREFLEMKMNSPVKEASLDEIIEALKTGGFDLAKVSKNEDDMRRGVAITLAKNPQFYRLPNSDWGLIAWYPNVKRAKAESKAADQKDANNSAVEPKKQPKKMKEKQTEQPQHQ